MFYFSLPTILTVISSLYTPYTDWFEHSMALNALNGGHNHTVEELERSCREAENVIQAKAKSFTTQLNQIDRFLLNA